MANMIIEEDVFRGKPLIISPKCDGTVRITASIKDLERLEYYNSTNTSEIQFYANYDSVTLGSNASTDFIIDKNGSVGATEVSVANLVKIPAFYDRCTVDVEFRVKGTYRGQTLEVENKLEVKFEEIPSWYEESYIDDVNGDITKYLIKSDKSIVKSSVIADNSTFTQVYYMDPFGGIPPFIEGWYTPIDKDGNAISDGALKRALLSPPTFIFTMKNNTASAVTINGLIIKFTFEYKEDGVLMNMGASSIKSERANIYTYSKGIEMNGDIEDAESTKYPLFCIAENYDIDEIVKVYGFYGKSIQSGDGWSDAFGTFVQLEALTLPGTNYAPVLWGKTEVLPKKDYKRIAYHGTSNLDFAKVITPQMIASDSKYRNIEVTPKQPGDEFSQFGTICVDITPNDAIEDKITISELSANVSKLRFFNVEVDFATHVEISKGEIDNLFSEMFYRNYKDAPILQSVRCESLYYVEFTINDYATYVPIYNNQTLEFRDTLSYGTVGVRSGDVFYINENIPNKISMRFPTTHKYEVQFNSDYDVYKDTYVMTLEDITGET
ncbi:MAG: hypothetical protein WC877_00190 [Dehalococcoidales bacterium]|jgi:hypothetical protein